MDAKEQLIAHLTSKENFDTVLEIYQKMPDVKESILLQFWEGVERKMNEKAKGSNWTVYRSDELISGYSKLGFKLKSHDSFMVIYELLQGDVYSGLWYDIESSSVEEQVYSHTLDYMERKGIKMESNRDYWPAWQWEPEMEFAEYGNLKRILPDTSDQVQNQAVEKLWNLAGTFEELIPKLVKLK